MNWVKKLYNYMRECFVITTYCNTTEKLNELKKCINNLKIFNIDILIHAHYPLDLEIQQSVKYYIYDSTNPVIRDGSKIIVRWKWYMTANKLLTMPTPDYSYAVINQWISSMKFLKEKNYDKIHVINYDVFINEFIFRNHQNFLDNYDVVFEYTNLNHRDYNANVISDKKLIYVVFFSIKKSFIDKFSSELTLEKYLQSKDTMLETFIMEVLEKIESTQNYNSFLPIGLDTYKIKKYDDSQFKLHLGDSVENNQNIRKEDCDVYTTISEANGFDVIKKKYKDEFGNDKDWCYVFGGLNSEYNKFEILIFEITKKIDELNINIDGEIIEIFDFTNNYYSIVTNYSMDKIIKIIDDEKLTITINGEKVNQSVLNAMKYQEIHPKFK